MWLLEQHPGGPVVGVDAHDKHAEADADLRCGEADAFDLGGVRGRDEVVEEAGDLDIGYPGRK